MNEPTLQLRGLRREYVTRAGTLTVLRGVDLDLFAGEIVGLVGPSGSGKSSLLHAAGLLERPNAGTVSVAGKDCTKLRDNARTKVRLNGVGFVYQFHHLLPELSAKENVALPAQIAGMSRTAAVARALDLLAELGLEARADHRPAQLSGGEQQRVAVARALVNKPKVLLADEPTGNLDPLTSESVFGSLKSLVKGQGVAALIATHNFELARHMDRVFALKDGQLEPWAG
jgi:lipoprotein-releasing system ATP-binding protein